MTIVPYIIVKGEFIQDGVFRFRAMFDPGSRDKAKISESFARLLGHEIVYRRKINNLEQYNAVNYAVADANRQGRFDSEMLEERVSDKSKKSAKSS